MSTFVSRTVSERSGFLQRTPISGRSLLLAALLTSCAGLASAQVQSSQFAGTESPARQSVSVNQLQTPENAQKAATKAREALVHGDYDSALKEAEHALKIFPHCAAALTIEGAVNLKRTNYAEADSDFQQAINEDPAAGTAYLGLGMAFTSQGRFKEALVPLERAAAFIPNSWTVYFESALAHLGVGDSQMAFKEITYAEKFAGVDPEKKSGTTYLRGVAHSLAKDYNAARDDWNESVKGNPSGAYAQLAKRRLEALGSPEANQNIAPSTGQSPK